MERVCISSNDDCLDQSDGFRIHGHSSFCSGGGKSLDPLDIFSFAPNIHTTITLSSSSSSSCTRCCDEEISFSPEFDAPKQEQESNHTESQRNSWENLKQVERLSPFSSFSDTSNNSSALPPQPSWAEAVSLLKDETVRVRVQAEGYGKVYIPSKVRLFEFSIECTQYPENSTDSTPPIKVVKWTILRRFSAFSTLHNQLVARWERNMTPELPNKRPSIFRHSQSFLRVRARDLAAYAQILVYRARSDARKQQISVNLHEESSHVLVGENNNNNNNDNASDWVFAFLVPDNHGDPSNELAHSQLTDFVSLSYARNVSNPAMSNNNPRIADGPNMILPGSSLLSMERKTLSTLLSGLSVLSSSSIVDDNSRSNSTSSSSSSTNNNNEKRGLGVKDFSLIRVIGKGSFGKVVLAESIGGARGLGYNSLVAIKALNIQDMINRQQVQRVHLECRCLKICQSPFVVKLRCAFKTKTHLYLVQDYCAGGELYCMLDRNGKLPADVACFIIAECVLALESLHAVGIAFRDFKPENIMIDAEGHTKLVDFGLAKEGVFSSVAGARSFVGTTEYLAPEMIRRRGHGLGVDWWALGMVLYELLNGLPPFFVEDRQLLMERILSCPLTFPPSITERTQCLIRGLLRRDPRRRLGALTDAEEIKRQSYFQSVDWKAMLEKRVEPLRRPKLSSPIDTKYFDETFTALPPVIEPTTNFDKDDMFIANSFSGEKNDPFEEFPFDGDGIALW